jgi:hypothetical protein
MPVEHDDQARIPTSDNQLPGEIERQRTDVRVVSVLGAIALVVAVGMWFYTKDREMVAGDGTTVKHSTTTGVATPRH